MDTTHTTTAPPDLQASIDFAASYADERMFKLDACTLRPLKPNGFTHTPAFMFVNYDKQGNECNELSNVRYDTKNKNGRWRCKKNAPYAATETAWEEFSGTGKKYLVEGNGQTIAGVGIGLPAIGIRGIHNWHSKGSKELLPELAVEIKPGDTVVVIPDADWKDNRTVHIGLWECLRAIRGLGAIAKYVDVPDVPGMENTGLDDLLAFWQRSGTDPTARFADLELKEDLTDPFIVDLKAPYTTAKHFLDGHYEVEGFTTLIHHKKQFYGWAGEGWIKLSPEVIKAQLYEFVHAYTVNFGDHHINSLLGAVRAHTEQETLDYPCWLEGGHPPATEVLSCSNGLLDLTSGEFTEHTPFFFNLNWSSVEYDPEAVCPDWLKFLKEVYAKDLDAIPTLQEVIGYTLTEDTTQQKAFMLVGVKRGGKGTIGRVIRHLIGGNACTAPTFGSLGERFGMEPLIGKKVAIMSDARISGKSNVPSAVENLMRITGEDAITIDRKHIGAWEGRLNTRILIFSNLVIRTLDNSGVFATRFILIPHRTSFYGDEDTALTNRLRAEGSGILNWALEGLVSLRDRGYFVQPAHGQEQVEEMERANSPILGFLADRCELEPGVRELKDDVYRAYLAWHSQNNVRVSELDKQGFSTALYAATEYAVEGKRPRINGKHTQCYVGLRLVKDVKRKKYD